MCFSTQQNNDKTGVFLHMIILVKTDCFEAAVLQVSHFVVKTVYFEQNGEYVSSLRNGMTV
jgi:hypothetical protein